MRRGSGRRVLAAAVVGTIVSPAHAEAQRIPADTSIEAALENVRTMWMNPWVASGILAQRFGPESPEKLAALTDSLVAIVVAVRSTEETEAYRAARGALFALGAVPVDAGAFDAVVRAYEGAQVGGLRAGALTGIAWLAGRGPPVLPYLREVAMEPTDLIAFTAVRLLADQTGAEGVAVSRELHRAGLVTQPIARQTLELIARQRGCDPG